MTTVKFFLRILFDEVRRIKNATLLFHNIVKKQLIAVIVYVPFSYFQTIVLYKIILYKFVPVKIDYTANAHNFSNPDYDI
jgi:hypothetical protein